MRRAERGPGQAAAVLGVQPNQRVLAGRPHRRRRPAHRVWGTDAAFVTDPGQGISATTKDWVETYVPNQSGANYTAHLTVGLDTVEHLKQMQAEPFDAFDVHPVALAVYQLGNNGTARTLLKSWALHA